MQIIKIDDIVFKASPKEVVFVNFIPVSQSIDSTSSVAYNKLNPLMKQYIEARNPKLKDCIRYNSETRNMVIYNVVVRKTHKSKVNSNIMLESLRNLRTQLIKYEDTQIAFSSKIIGIDPFLMESLFLRVFRKTNLNFFIYSKG